MRRVALAGLATFIFAFTVQAERLKIGALTELSGSQQAIGEECKRGYEIAVEHFSSPEVATVIYGDHQRIPKVGLSEFLRLIDTEKVNAVVSNGAPVVMALNPVSAERRIPLVGVVVLPRFIQDNPYAVRVWGAPAIEARALKRLFEKLNSSRIALLTLQDDYTVSVSNELRGQLRGSGIELVSDEELLTPTTDFQALISRIRASKPDSIFLNVVGDSLPIVMRRVREQGITAPMVGTFSLARKDLRDAAGEAAQGALFVEITSNWPKFESELLRKFSAPRNTSLNITCFLGMAAALQAASVSSNNPETFKQNLLNVSEIKTLDTPIAVINREAQVEFAVRRIQGSSVVNDAALNTP